MRKLTTPSGWPTGATVCLIAALALPVHAAAQTCEGRAPFRDFVKEVAEQARQAGLGNEAVAALETVRFDQSVINRDRATAVFAQDFLTFAKRMVSGYRLKHGKRHLRERASLFEAVEREFGVPGAVIAAFWALETDFGANNGNFSTLTALATLAYDCRRPELFRPQLIDALRLIDAGDLSASQMRGAPAGELGQVQFLPSDYWRSAVDFDRDGRRDLIGSVDDAIASAAKLLQESGWQRGEPWLEEVQLPRQMDWAAADIYSPRPWSFWRDQGVERRKSEGEPASDTPVALLLPMGRHGPAFLAYRNFAVYLEWNQSLVYTTTAAYLAMRIAGEPRLRVLKAREQPLSMRSVKALQRELRRKGHDVGKVDGIIGSRTRAAVRMVQAELAMPADAYPDRALLKRLGVRALAEPEDSGGGTSP